MNKEQMQQLAEEKYPMPDQQLYFDKVAGLDPDSEEFTEIARELMDLQILSSKQRSAFISGMEVFQKQLKNRITELRNADAEFCKDRWNMALQNFERALAREESNKVTFARQVLEEFILPVS